MKNGILCVLNGEDALTSTIPLGTCKKAMPVNKESEIFMHSQVENTNLKWLANGAFKWLANGEALLKLVEALLPMV